VALHPLGDMAGQRASDDGVHVRPTNEIGERVPHPVHVKRRAMPVTSMQRRHAL
jgi:hypothetical protein